MKKRILYAILWGIPGLLVAFLVYLVMAAVLGVSFYIFVSGDSSWPSWADTVINVILKIIFMSVLLSSIIIGLKTGKKLEKNKEFNKKHVLISATLTALLIAVIASLFSYYYLRDKAGLNDPEHLALAKCDDFCTKNGYLDGQLPPSAGPEARENTCVCINKTTYEATEFPLDSEAS